jgi:hypothetical protein
MRILIIATARSGGYQLNEWLAMELGYKMVHEPTKNNVHLNRSNIVVKYLIEEIEDDKMFDLKKWDKIIGLVRMDYRECSISFVKATKTNEWHKPYQLSDEWISENKKEILDFENQVKELSEKLNRIKEIELFVTYEGIYNTKEDIQKIKNYVGITNARYEYLLDNSKRLRNNENLKVKLL